MILATYQPYIRRPEKFAHKWEDVREYVGFDPIFCFAANTAEEAIIGSILSAPSNPEKLIIFETPYYVELDMVQWQKKLALDKQTENFSMKVQVPLEECFRKNIKYKEYVVPEIINIIEEVDIKQAFFDNYKPADLSNPFANVLFQLAEKAKIEAEELSKRFGVEIDQDKHWLEYSPIEKRKLKEIFQYTFLPLLYPAVMGNNFLESPMFSFEQYLTLTVSKDIDVFLDTSADIKYKAENALQYIYARLQICTSEKFLSIMEDKKAQRVSTKINPNAPCPCGSGKKYKKCCRNLT